MDNGIHFISGLPRSGSTLLAALLRQNPGIHAAMTSPLGSLINGLMGQMSQSNEGGLFIDDEQRVRVLRGVVDSFYGDIHSDKLVIDTNRMWCAKMALLATLFPQAKVIVCVRNPAWILDSIEALMRRNAVQPSGIFSYETSGTVYSRADGLLAGSGMIGFALNAVREAVFGEQRGRLLLVRYDSLTVDPLATLNRIYDFLGLPHFAHDPNNIEPDYEAMMFDARLGTPGLHAVGAKVQLNMRATILPPDLFGRVGDGAWWDGKEGLPPGVQMV